MIHCLRLIQCRRLVGIAFSVLGFVPFSYVHGSLLYFDPEEATVYRGDTVTLALRIDTNEAQGECINTIDAVVHYDSSVRAVDVSRGHSILSIWLEDPIINEDDNTIRFAGGIPGGYCGRIAGDPSLTNIVAEVVFRSPGFSVGTGGESNAHVWLDEATQVLLHDGLGSPSALSTRGANIVLLEGAGPSTDDSWRERVSDDSIPPADFIIELQNYESAFSGNYFITFNTQDKQSGIDHYEVMEEPITDLNAFKWGRADAPWITAESPYVLKDQTLNSTIRVKAIDKAGNETIAVYVPDEALRAITVGNIMTWIVLGGLATLLVFISGLYFMKRKRRLITQYETQDKNID